MTQLFKMQCVYEDGLTTVSPSRMKDVRHQILKNVYDNKTKR